MLAKSLELALIELCRDADTAPLAADDIARRFVSLRGSARLPRGRAERDCPLTDEQIAAVVLGMTTIAPGWAGHAVAVLAGLQPVGGPDAAFMAAPTLLQAVARFLAAPEDGSGLVAVRVSLAEAGTNSHGSATIVYECNGMRRTTSYDGPSIQWTPLLSP